MKIGLTYTGSEEKQQNYIHWLQSGGTAEVLSLKPNEYDLNQLAECDALVLTGGVDVCPEFYHMTEQYENAPDKWNKKRDEFEIAAFQLMQERKLPVLGICRGLQLINCIQGGNLRQDLGKDLNLIHRAADLIDKAHGATVQSGTLLQDIIRANRIVINSAHHQAVDKVAGGLMVNCLSDDGCIEGLERRDKNDLPFLLCIQWHPERMYKFMLQDSPVARGIRDRFLEEIKNK